MKDSCVVGYCYYYVHLGPITLKQAKEKQCGAKRYRHFEEYANIKQKQKAKTWLQKLKSKRAYIVGEV